jgi:hypothetical protein
MKNHHHHAAAALAISSAIFLAGTVAAQPAQPPPAAPPVADAAATRASDAERLFREGRTAMEAGDLVHACPKFAESEKLDPAPGTLLSLADCEERARSFVRAREHYQLAASGFPKKDPRRAFATGRAQAVEKRVAHVTLRLSGDAPADASVRLGETVVPRSDLGTSTAIDPGDVQVKVSAPGRKDNAFIVTFAEGETKDVACELGAPETARAEASTATAPVPSPADDRVSASSSDPRLTVSYVLLGLGAASLIVGGVSGVLAAGKAGTVKDHCDASSACDQEGVDAASAGRFLAPLSTVTLIAGAVLAGAGAYFFFASAKGHKAPPTALLQALQLRGTF